MQAYGYFKKVGGCWVQQGTETYARAVAVAVFQDKLIWEGGEIRPVRKAAAAPLRDPRPTSCEPCQRHLHTQCKRDAECKCACRMFNKAVSEGKQEALL